MRKKLPFIPLQPPDKLAEYAGFMPPEPAPYNNLSNKYNIFRDSIVKLLFSNFKWYGLSFQEAQTLEYNLIFRGRACGIKSAFDLDTKTPEGIFYGAYGTETDTLKYNFYGYPTEANCTGMNGIVLHAKSEKDFEICFDSCDNIYSYGMLTSPIYSYVEVLAQELDRAYSAWQVAAETRKLGMVFQCSNKKSSNILKQILKKLSDNDPFVVVDADIDNQMEPIFSSGTAQGINEFHMHFMNTWGMVLDLLGLENNSQNKRERLVVTEAEMNRSLSRYLGANRLRARKTFAENWSKKTGLDIRVENYLDSIIQENSNDANTYGIEGEADDRPTNNYPR